MSGPIVNIFSYWHHRTLLKIVAFGRRQGALACATSGTHFSTNALRATIYILLNLFARNMNSLYTRL